MNHTLKLTNSLSQKLITSTVENFLISCSLDKNFMAYVECGNESQMENALKPISGFGYEYEVENNTIKVYV